MGVADFLAHGPAISFFAFGKLGCVIKLNVGRSGLFLNVSAKLNTLRPFLDPVRQQAHHELKSCKHLHHQYM